MIDLDHLTDHFLVLELDKEDLTDLFEELEKNSPESLKIIETFLDNVE